MVGEPGKDNRDPDDGNASRPPARPSHIHPRRQSHRAPDGEGGSGSVFGGVGRWVGNHRKPAEPDHPATAAWVRRPGDRVVRLVQRHRRLRRVLGVSGLFSTGYGNVGSSIYYALGVTALFALGAAPIALLAAGVFFVLTVLSYAEATVAVPEAGGASSFARRGFNELVSFLAGWATLLSYTVTIAISAYTAVGYLSVFFPYLDHYPVNALVAVFVIVSLMTLNIIGVREAASFSVVFAVIDLSIQVVLVVVGSIFLLSLPLLIGQIHFGVAPTWPNFVAGIAVAMVAYTGIETISNMAEESRNPARSVPRAYFGLIFAVLVLFVGISTVALSAMPIRVENGSYTTELATSYLDDPVAGVAHKLPPPFSTVLTPVVSVLATSILLIGANAGVIGVSRLSFSMGMHRQLPGFWSLLHPQFLTPYAAIAFFGVAAGLLALTGSITQMSEIYIFGATLNFTVAHASVVGMRVREPNLNRPFKLPLNVVVRGREIPVLALIGGLGTAGVWVMMLAGHPFARYVGLSWMVVGLALYVLYRKRNGLPLLVTVPAEPSPSAEKRPDSQPARPL